MSKKTVLDVRNISISFSQYVSVWKKRSLNVIRDLSVAVGEGEMVAVVGASGSGKSLLAHAILGILPYNAILSGEMLYFGETLTQKRIEELRGSEIALAPQSVAFLDPLMKVGPQVRKGQNDTERKVKSAAALSRYGLGSETEELYPFELSGGMARRVLIAATVMESPRLVIADEPTPGLHLDVAKRVMSHFREIADGGAGVLVITHDLELAAETADRVVVFYSGTTIEEALAEDFADVNRLRHPYTRALWRAMPANGFYAFDGMQPYAANKPEGCPFRGSCEKADELCEGAVRYAKINGGFVRCKKEIS